MSPIVARIKHELMHPLPAFIFFFTIFNLLNMTWGLMLREEGVARFSFLSILIGAVVVTKVFIIIDNLPFTNAFSNKPLIYQTLWKTFLYGTGTLIIRTLDFFIPFLWSSESLEVGSALFLSEMDWDRFWALQIWFTILFFIFVSGREFVLAIGAAKIKKIFLGR